MTDLDQMTPERVAELTDQEFDQIVLEACAEKGVKILVGDPPQEPPKEVPKDVEAWQVPALLFRDRQDAEKVLAYASQFERISVEYAPGTYERVIAAYDGEPNERPQSVMLYSAKRWAENCGLAKQVKELRSQYEADLREWNEAVKARDAIVGDMRQRFLRAVRLIERRREFDRLFAQYVAIARGDGDVAAAFLKKAYPSWPDGWQPEPFRAHVTNCLLTAAGANPAEVEVKTPADEIPF